MDRFHHRVSNGWRTEFRVWDGEPVDSWSFHCYRIPKDKESPPAAFYRFLLPATADPSILRRMAEAVSGMVPVLSGHGGLVLLYDGSRLFTSFDQIYALTRRYWGFDVEHLNSTLGLMRQGIKGVSWLTLLGEDFAQRLGGPKALEKLGKADVTVSEGIGSVLITAGPEPEILDQNRPGLAVDKYARIAQSLAPVFLPEFPEFPGRFSKEENSAAWFRRFLEPDGWRR